MLLSIKKLYNKIFGSENDFERRKFIKRMANNPQYIGEEEVERVLEMAKSDEKEISIDGMIGLVVISKYKPGLRDEFSDEIINTAFDNVDSEDDEVSNSAMTVISSMSVDYKEEMSNNIDVLFDDIDSDSFIPRMVALGEVADEYPEKFDSYDEEVLQLIKNSETDKKLMSVSLLSVITKRSPHSMEKCRNYVHKLVGHDVEDISRVASKIYSKLYEIDSDLVQGDESTKKKAEEIYNKD
jgi:hypothetical protein